MSNRGFVRVVDPLRVGLAPLTVRFRPDEPAVSLLARLAVRRGSRTLTDYLATLPYCPSRLAADVRTGRSLDTLARISGIPSVRIQASTPVRKPEGYSLNGVRLENFGRLAFPRTLGRVCLACLAEDVAHGDGPLECRAFRRFWWGLEAISGCPQHRVPLLTACPCCDAPLTLRNLRPDVCACGTDLTRLPPPQEVPGYDAQLLAMMRGEARPAWANGLSVDFAASVALRTGILDAHGSKMGLARTSLLGERMELTARGAAILDQGWDAFTDLLDRASARGLRRTPGEAYGDLCKWLGRMDDAALEPFRNRIFEHARRRLRSPTDVQLFGRVIHEVARSAPSSGTAPLSGRDALGRAIARARDLFGPGRKSDVQALLGLSRNQFRAVMERGGNPDRLPGSERFSPQTHFYDLEGVVGLFEGALRAPVFDVVPPHLIRVVDARKLFRRWVAVYRALREGRLPIAGTLSGGFGFTALLVEREALLTEVPTGRMADPEPSISPADAAVRTGLTKVTLSKLRAAGHLQFVRRAVRNGQIAYGPALASLADLERDFISLGALERATGTARSMLSSALADAGVHSVVSGSKNAQPVFRRVEVMVALGPAQLSPSAVAGKSKCVQEPTNCGQDGQFHAA